MGQYIFKIGDKDYKVDVKSIEGTKATVEIDGKAFSLDIKQLGRKEETTVKKPVMTTSFAQAEQKPTGAAPPKKTVPVRAPIPGLILKLFVKEGDTVKVGQDILVMEAMKMENQIQSTKGGKIVRIPIKVGDSVMQDDILVEIES